MLIKFTLLATWISLDLHRSGRSRELDGSA